jgi:hypothetical protein
MSWKSSLTGKKTEVKFSRSSSGLDVGLVDRFALDVDTLEKERDSRANARLNDC